MNQNQKYNQLVKVRTIREQSALRTLVSSRKNQTECRENTLKKQSEMDSFLNMARQEEDALFEKMASASRPANLIDIERRGMSVIHGYRDVFANAVNESREKEQQADSHAEQCSSEFNARMKKRGKVENLAARVRIADRVIEERMEESETEDEFLMAKKNR